MSASTDVRKSIDDSRKLITDPKPLYAVVGLGDRFVASLRDSTARLQSTRIEPSGLQERATTSLADLRAGLVGARDLVQAQLAAVPDAATGVASRLVGTYDELAERGAATVGRVRRQQATQDLAAQARTTVSQAKATRTTARKSAAATTARAKATRTTARKGAASTSTRAKATRTTARKGAASTTTRAKGAATSARKTGAASRKAATAAAAKVG